MTSRILIVVSVLGFLFFSPTSTAKEDGPPALPLVEGKQPPGVDVQPLDGLVGQPRQAIHPARAALGLIVKALGFPWALAAAAPRAAPFIHHIGERVHLWGTLVYTVAIWSSLFCLLGLWLLGSRPRISLCVLVIAVGSAVCVIGLFFDMAAINAIGIVLVTTGKLSQKVFEVTREAQRLRRKAAKCPWLKAWMSQNNQEGKDGEQR